MSGCSILAMGMFLFRDCQVRGRARFHNENASRAQFPDGGIEKCEHEHISCEADDNKDKS
jgi:hypothetical protein